MAARNAKHSIWAISRKKNKRTVKSLLTSTFVLNTLKLEQMLFYFAFLLVVAIKLVNMNGYGFRGSVCVICSLGHVYYKGFFTCYRIRCVVYLYLLCTSEMMGKPTESRRRGGERKRLPKGLESRDNSRLC